MRYLDRSFRAWNLLLAALMLSTGWVQAQSDERLRSSDNYTRYTALAERAQKEGAVRILVQLSEERVNDAALWAPATHTVPEFYGISVIQQAFLEELASIDKRVTNRRYTYIPFVALRADTEVLEVAMKSPYVEAVFEDAVFDSQAGENTELIGAEAAWENGGSGEGQIVAVLDTGVDLNHPFIAGKVTHGACFSSNYNSPTGDFESVSVCPEEAEEGYGINAGRSCGLEVAGCDHGTRVAGIAAGRGDSFSGVARDASIMSVQVFSRFESFCGDQPCARSWVSDQIAGLEHIYLASDSLNIAVINMSLGGGHYTSQERCDAVNPAMLAMFGLLYDVGIPVIAAAGNNGLTDGLVAPACLSNSISVGSTNLADGISPFSSSATFLDLLAPGEDIVSSVPGGLYQTGTGTSFSAPHVAGAWAILRAGAPFSSIVELMDAFNTTGVGILDERNNLTVPRIQVDLALQFTVLPVDLVRFEAIASGSEIELQWETAGERNNAGFEVQHAFGGAFRTLDFVRGGGTRSEPLLYSYTVDRLLPGMHTFRLKQIDFDGTRTFTHAIEGYVELTNAYFMDNAYPNPFNPTTRFTLTVAREQRVRIDVYDVLGKRVGTLYDHILEPRYPHVFSLDGSNMAGGLYLIQATGQYFKVTRSVMLLK